MRATDASDDTFVLFVGSAGRDPVLFRNRELFGDAFRIGVEHRLIIEVRCCRCVVIGDATCASSDVAACISLARANEYSRIAARFAVIVLDAVVAVATGATVGVGNLVTSAGSQQSSHQHDRRQMVARVVDLVSAREPASPLLPPDWR